MYLRYNRTVKSKLVFYMVLVIYAWRGEEYESLYARFSSKELTAFIMYFQS